MERRLVICIFVLFMYMNKHVTVGLRGDKTLGCTIRDIQSDQDLG